MVEQTVKQITGIRKVLDLEVITEVRLRFNVLVCLLNALPICWDQNGWYGTREVRARDKEMRYEGKIMHGNRLEWRASQKAQHGTGFH